MDRPAPPTQKDQAVGRIALRVPVDGEVGARAATAFAASVTFDAVTRAFGPTPALRGVSFEIAAGEVVCLLGPSGCGKTTLLRIASGIERPTSGRVLLNGREVAGPNVFVPPEERNVGLMFQDLALFPHLTIADNVAFGLRKLPRAEARREALAVLARVGLARYADDYPHMLSGGEQQRVALARAILPRPAVLLMDEPFTGLDVQLREQIQTETMAILRETRSTCLMVTHHADEALRLGDRIAVMRAGRLVQIGKAEQLYRAPADLTVARMFSEINEIRYRVIGNKLRTPMGVLEAPELDDGDEAIVCIRRRTIELRRPGDGIPGRVLRVRFMGDLAWIDLAVQGFDEPLTTIMREWEVPARGDEIAVRIDPTSLLVFPVAMPAQ